MQDSQARKRRDQSQHHLTIKNQYIFKLNNKIEDKRNLIASLCRIQSKNFLNIFEDEQLVTIRASKQNNTRFFFKNIVNSSHLEN